MPSVAPGSKTPNIDFRKSLRQTFAINEKANQLLLSHIADAAWRAAPPTGKGRSIGSIAALWEWGTPWRECGFGK
jgi:hypothetical protein